MVFIVLAFGMLYLAGLDLKYLGGAALAGAISAPLLYFFCS